MENLKGNGSPLQVQKLNEKSSKGKENKKKQHSDIAINAQYILQRKLYLK